MKGSIVDILRKHFPNLQVIEKDFESECLQIKCKLNTFENLTESFTESFTEIEDELLYNGLDMEITEFDREKGIVTMKIKAY